jgi:uncharacterized protein with GYD domain
MGVTVKDIFWTLGRYDVVVVVEGQEADATALLLKVASLGNLKLESLRALTEAEIEPLLKKI